MYLHEHIAIFSGNPTNNTVEHESRMHNLGIVLKTMSIEPLVEHDKLLTLRPAIEFSPTI